MNFKSLGLMALVLVNAALLPITPAQQTVVKPINKQNVLAAQKTYTANAEWVPYVQYAALGLSAALVAYMAYTYFKGQAPAEITTKKADELITATALLHKKYDEALLEFAKNQTSTITTQATDDSHVVVKALTKTANVAVSGAQWVGSTMASGASWAGSLIAMSLNASAYSSLFNHFVTPYFALTGTLYWYIQKHTLYTAHLNELANALQSYEIYKQDLPAITQQLISDMEKIIGYMAHFATISQEPSSDIMFKAACARHMQNLEKFTNDIATAVNAKSNQMVIMEKLGILQTELMHTIAFVNPADFMKIQQQQAMGLPF